MSDVPAETRLASVPTPQAAVLFADLSGSTTLYETLGDALAKRLVDECLSAMRAVTLRHGGRVVKAIGDELMCVFLSPDQVAIAASEMQQTVDALPVVAGAKRAIRIGFQVGPVIEADGDVFGDTVNTAARVAGLAKARQIYTTLGAVGRMSAILQSQTRRIAALALKGKSDEIEVCEVLWQPGDDLTMMTGSVESAVRPGFVLELRHGTTRIVLDALASTVVLGRDAGCQIVLNDRKASRAHARIERRRDKYVLADQSTNGTYVSFDGEAELALRREEVILRGQGRIVFGHGIDESDEDAVSFSLRPADACTP